MCTCVHTCVYVQTHVSVRRTLPLPLTFRGPVHGTARVARVVCVHSCTSRARVPQTRRRVSLCHQGTTDRQGENLPKRPFRLSSTFRRRTGLGRCTDVRPTCADRGSDIVPHETSRPDPYVIREVFVRKDGEGPRNALRPPVCGT